MKLHRQLLLVSLFVLSLPWAGCEYIRQMEEALRDGQVRALTATARAVAARMASESAAIALPSHPAVYNPRQQFYLHPLPSPGIVDGYSEEWTGLGAAGEVVRDSERDHLSVTSYGGWHGNSIYLFFSVRDPTHDHHNPQQDSLASGDHLVLRTLSGPFDLREYVFRAGGSGSVTAHYADDSGEIRREHRIRGEWRETGEGYAIELRLPFRLAPQGLDFYFVDAGRRDQPVRLGNYNPVDYPAPWVQPDPELAEILEPYSDGTLQISVINRHQWMLAQAGGLSPAAAERPGPLGPETGAHPILAWLYRLAIGRQDFPPLVNGGHSGRLAAAETDRALEGDVGTGWYRHGKQWVGRVAAPVEVDGRNIGAVAVEQSTDTLLAETNAAFNHLFMYTLLATGLAGFGLLAYASWLSWRIRRLNRAADNAVGDDGRIRPEMLDSRAGDELGDLSRGYGRLLSRLRDYTDYLRTLASKLSHELRTPLAVMNSSLENLDHEGLNESATRYVQRARDASQRLSAILNAMSSANRVEESIQQAHRENFPLDELLEGMVTAYRATYPQAQFHLQMDPAHAGFTFCGSPDLIVQLLDKLVDNARDFCPPGEDITLSLADDGSYYRLSVTNTGPLLPEYMHGQLFDSLVSVRDKISSGGEAHLGLGLYVVRLITEFHGGRVAARNLDDGSGVTFEVLLPRGDARAFGKEATA